MTTKHGECCYCRRCGKLHDDCRCDLDDAVDELERTKADLTAARTRYGTPIDEADVNGTMWAQLKWWKDRTDELHDDLAAARAEVERLTEVAASWAHEYEAAKAEIAELKKKVQEAYYEGFVDAQAHCVGRWSHGSPDIAWMLSNIRKNL